MSAKKGNDYAKGNKGGGRKSSYKEEYSDLAYKFCLLGATDKELAEMFEVSEVTINNWKDEHEEFSLALKKGKQIADANVADRLYKRAMGFEAPDVVTATFQGMITDMKEVTKVYPPDTTAAIFWLKNRQPKRWRDKQEIDHTTAGESLKEKPDLSKFSKEELASYIALQRKLKGV